MRLKILALEPLFLMLDNSSFMLQLSNSLTEGSCNCMLVTVI